jgi:N-acetylglucosaminyl-diphospho-decaprenol L-rhamnosyltransferase
LAKIIILIVGYRNAGDIRNCLRALAALIERPTFDVFIAENGGAAGMDALVAMLDAGDPAWAPADDVDPTVFPDHGLRRRGYRLARPAETSSIIHVAEMKENLGYAGGVNAWLRPLMKADGWTAAWVLNPDTVPRADALAQLADYSASLKKGMVASLIVSDDDPSVVAQRGLAWRKWIGRCEAVGRNEKASVEPDTSAVEADLTAPSGASLYVTKALIERIGLMYDPYFLYFEDLEWGDRAKRLGELGHAHKSVVAHKQGTTIGSLSSRAGLSPRPSICGLAIRFITLGGTIRPFWRRRWPCCSFSRRASWPRALSAISASRSAGSPTGALERPEGRIPCRRMQLSNISSRLPLARASRIVEPCRQAPRLSA